MPPAALLDPEVNAFAPAPDVEAWLRATFIVDDAPLHNEEHQHLNDARLGVLWASAPAKVNGLQAAGMAEMPMLRGKGWVKTRQEYQFLHWFGEIPDFVITFWGPYAAHVDDVGWCAIAEHELLHCGQLRDQWGDPRFSRVTGLPLFTMRPHDVEEFVTIVERYGAGAAAGRTAALVRAAQRQPSVGRAQLEAACGTCGLKVA